MVLCVLDHVWNKILLDFVAEICLKTIFPCLCYWNKSW